MMIMMMMVVMVMMMTVINNKYRPIKSGFWPLWWLWSIPHATFEKDYAESTLCEILALLICIFHHIVVLCSTQKKSIFPIKMHMGMSSLPKSVFPVRVADEPRPLYHVSDTIYFRFHFFSNIMWPTDLYPERLPLKTTILWTQSVLKFAPYTMQDI
jgi:exosortase/archaeosortase